MDKDEILKSFTVQDTLNPKVWTNPNDPKSSRLKSEIRSKLLEIANQFQEFIGLDVIVSDIHMTGSLANFNWSKYSDIDLHLIVDFSQFNEKQKELFTELFKLKKTLFNYYHNIKIHNFDVELYVQDLSEEHTSTGVYSVLMDEWVVVPTKESPNIDKSILKQKVDSWIHKIDETIEQVKEEKDLKKALEFIDRLKTKIKDYRKIGLSKEGEFSYENLVFKYLRRNGYIEKLFNFQNEYMDKSLSLEKTLKESRIISEATISFDPTGNYSDPTFGLPTGNVDSTSAVYDSEGGQWGGSMQRALAFAKVANDYMGKNIISSQKRRRKSTASGRVSDHYYGNPEAYAVDLAIRGKKGDELYNYLMDWFGRPELKIPIGTPNNGNKWHNVTVGGYRYQIGWKSDSAHNNHIHIGVKKVDGKQPDTPKDTDFVPVQTGGGPSTEKAVREKDPTKADLVTDINDFFDALKSITSPITQQKAGSYSYQKPVEAIQIGLEILGYELVRFGVDGKYGPETQKAVSKFLSDNKIENKDKGSTFTPEMANKMFSLLQSQDVEREDVKALVNPTVPTTPKGDESFYSEILKGIGAPVTQDNLSVLYAWRQAEGGKAKNNPFNTTYRVDKDKGMTKYNFAGVKNYSTPEFGIEATVRTLLLKNKYECIVAGLRNEAPPRDIVRCRAFKKWGTGDLIAKVMDSYEKGYTMKPPPIQTA